MKWKWVTLIFFLAMLKLAAAEAPPEEFIDDSPGLGLMALFMILIALVLIGVGIVVGVIAFMALAVVTALGVVSSSALLGLYRQRLSSGLRAFHYQICALGAIPAGAAALWLANRLFDFHLRDLHIMVFGGIAGACGGLVIAFAFDRLGVWIYTRFVKPRLAVRSVDVSSMQ